MKRVTQIVIVPFYYEIEVSRGNAFYTQQGVVMPFPCFVYLVHGTPITEATIKEFTLLLLILGLLAALSSRD